MGLKQTLGRCSGPINTVAALFELTGDHHGGGQNNGETMNGKNAAGSLL
jgi:hypothetical protein